MSSTCRTRRRSRPAAGSRSRRSGRRRLAIASSHRSRVNEVDWRRRVVWEFQLRASLSGDFGSPRGACRQIDMLSIGCGYREHHDRYIAESCSGLSGNVRRRTACGLRSHTAHCPGFRKFGPEGQLLARGPGYGGLHLRRSCAQVSPCQAEQWNALRPPGRALSLGSPHWARTKRAVRGNRHAHVRNHAPM
jgi:hypothetical protein